MRATVLVFVFWLGFAGTAAADEGDVAALKKQLGSKSAEERGDALRALGKIEGEPVSKLIVGALRDREPSVREEATRALAGRTDETSLRALRAALKTFEKDEDLLPVVVFALGESHDAESASAVVRLLRKSVTRDPRMTRTAIEALGFMRSPESLELLMELYLQATSTAGAVHPELADELLRALQALAGTGWIKRDTWQEWWRHARGSWKPTPLKPEDDPVEYRHDGWRVSIARPEGGRWAMEPASGAVARVTFKGANEEARFAWVEVRARAAREGDPKDLQAWAKTWRGWMEEGLENRKDEQWGVPGRIGPYPALLLTTTGIGRGYVATWRTWLVEKNDLLYAVTAKVESGRTDRVAEEVESILSSFRILD
jgi:hypothetical protein